MPKIYIISGGPGTGKTSVINELEKRGFKILKEAARELSKTDKRFIGKSVLEVNKKDFQDAIFEFQIKQIKEIETRKKERENNKFNKINNKREDDKENKNEIVFSDRGIGDTLVYYKINNLKIPKEKLEKTKKIRYKKIFILDFLDFYEHDELRKESKEEQEKIHSKIIKMYENLGYKNKIVIVPFMSIEERADFVLNNL